jgi:hypothetical protein
MYKSLLIGFLYPITIIFSGWIRVLLSFISISLGSGIPTLYFLMGISFVKIFPDTIPFWPGYIFGLIFSIIITNYTINHDTKFGYYSTVSTCGSGFIIGSIIGLVFRLF